MIKEILLLLFLIMLFIGMAIPATANEPMAEKNEVDYLHVIRAGVLAHDVDDLWSGTRKEGGVDLNIEIIFKLISNFFIQFNNIFIFQNKRLKFVNTINS